MTVFGYIRTSRSPEDAAEQRRQIRWYACAVGVPPGQIRFLVDRCSCDVPFAGRPGGGELLSSVKPGDRVITRRLINFASCPREIVDILRDWNSRGIILDIVEADGGPISTADPVQASAAVQAFEAAARFQEMQDESHHNNGATVDGC